MQGLKMHWFYGTSIPMFLAASDSEIDEVLKSISGGYSARLLNSLCVEGEMLRYSMYDSGRLRYVTDEESKPTQNLIKYVDFCDAYSKYMKALEKGEIQPIAEDSSELDLFKLTPEETGYDTQDLLSSDETSLFDDGALIEDGMVESDLLEDSIIDDDGVTDDGVLDESAVMGSSLAQADEISDDFIDDSPLSSDISGDIEESDEMMEQTLAEDGSLLSNKKLLGKLAYDEDFYKDFVSNSYLSILSRISSWVPEKITATKDIRSSSGNAEECERLRSIIQNQKNRIDQSGPTSSMSEFAKEKLLMLQEELTKYEERLAELEERSINLSKETANFIRSKLSQLPSKLQREYKQGSTTKIMTDKEFEILTGLHEICSKDTEGVMYISSLINRLTSIRDLNVTNSPKFLNMKYSQLSSKETVGQLMLFNKRYHDFIMMHTGSDRIKVIKQGRADCEELLNSKSHGADARSKLRSMFIEDPKELEGNGRIGKGMKMQLRGQTSIVPAVMMIKEDQELRELLQYNSEELDEELLTDLLKMLVTSTKIVEVTETVQAFVALYKLWVFIHRQSTGTILAALGVYEEISQEELYGIATKFKILGLYNYPVEIFEKCCDIGIAISNTKTSVIKRTARPHLYDNLEMLRRNLASAEIMYSDEYQRIHF